MPTGDVIRRCIDSDVAKKTCTVNGTWYKKNSLEWTDYRQCLDKQVVVCSVCYNNVADRLMSSLHLL